MKEKNMKKNVIRTISVLVLIMFIGVSMLGTLSGTSSKGTSSPGNYSYKSFAASTKEEEETPTLQAFVVIYSPTVSTTSDPEFSLSMNTTAKVTAYVEEYRLGVWANAAGAKYKSLSGTSSYFLKFGDDFNYYFTGEKHKLRLRLEGQNNEPFYSNDFEITGIKNTPIFNVYLNCSKGNELTFEYEYDNYMSSENINISIARYVPKSKSWTLLKSIVKSQSLTAPKVSKDEKNVTLNMVELGYVKIVLPETPYTKGKTLYKTITKREYAFSVKKSMKKKTKKYKVTSKKTKKKVTKKKVTKYLQIKVTAKQGIKEGTFWIYQIVGKKGRSVFSNKETVDVGNYRVLKVKKLEMKTGKKTIKLKIDGKTIDKNLLKKDKYFVLFKPKGVKSVPYGNKELYFIRNYTKLNAFTKNTITL